MLDLRISQNLRVSLQFELLFFLWWTGRFYLSCLVNCRRISCTLIESGPGIVNCLIHLDIDISLATLQYSNGSYLYLEVLQSVDKECPLEDTTPDFHYCNAHVMGYLPLVVLGTR